MIGAGNAGELIVREMVKGRSGYTVIGILDDDPAKQVFRLHGVKVLGKIDRLDRILRDTRLDEVVIAMPSASGARRQLVVDVCGANGVPVRTLPGPEELLGADSLVTRLREVRVEDLLGREPVRVDVDVIGAYVTDRVVLVTGAGGSIGSELVRQIARLRPAQLVLVDNGETNLFSIARELDDRRVDGVVPVLADVKDTHRMRALLGDHAPHVVFHAAAYKHVPVMEQNPLEAIRNNTLATRDLAIVAREAGVERFVLVSTDKAVNPQTVMGASKALCEWVVEAAAQEHSDTRFIAVRFGNVLASSGSVIPIFREQIDAGGPDHRHGRADDALLHDDQGGRPARDRGRRRRRVGRHLRARHGRARLDHAAGAGHEAAVGQGRRDPGDRDPARREAPRGAVRARRARRAHPAREAAGGAARADRRAWLSERLAVLEARVLAGDASGLVAAVHETVRNPVRAMPGRDPATVGG